MIFFQMVWKLLICKEYWYEHLSDKDSMHVAMVLFSNKSLHLMNDINGKCRSSSQVNSYQSKEHSDDDDEITIENGKIQHYNEDENRVGKNKITDFVGVLFSYTRMAVVKQTRTKSRIFCPSTIARCLLGSFRNIRRIVCFGRRRHYSRKHIWRRYWNLRQMCFLPHNPFSTLTTDESCDPCKIFDLYANKQCAYEIVFLYWLRWSWQWLWGCRHCIHICLFWDKCVS